MDWFEFLLKVPVAYVEKAEAIANMAVPYGIYTEDYSDLESGAWEIAHIDLIDEELLKKDRNNATIHIYFSTEDNMTEARVLLEELLKNAEIPYSVEWDVVAESKWRDEWKKYFKITEIGQRLVIVPKWEEYHGDDSRKQLIIDPGAAFGTGTHATTSLCLILLEEYVKDAAVLDIGCGSGILSIAAALLGAKKAIGVDIDSVAVRVARENAKMNGVSSNTEFVEGDLTEKITGKFGVVCANIVADAIISLLKPVKELLDDNGVFICSGIIDNRSDEVADAIEKEGYSILSHKKKDNWHAFLLCCK